MLTLELGLSGNSMKGKARIAADGRADEVCCNYFHHAARYIQHA